MQLDSFRLALAAAAIGLALPAAAQDSTVPEHLLGMVGDWRLEQEDATLPFCALSLTEEESIGGWAIAVPQPCPAPYPPADSLVSWNVDDNDGSVILLDAERSVVLRLYEDEDGLFITGPGHQPTFYLTFPWDDEGSGGEADGL